MTSHPRILHIGQRKTGTTWLQFGAQQACEAGALAYEHWRLAAWAKSLTWRSASDADYATLAGMLPGDEGKPALASLEALIMHDPSRMAEAVRKVWPDAQILVTTRAPRDYLLSSFNNNSMSESGEAANFAERFGRRHMRRSHDLDGVARGYGQVFGADRVHFLPYELLRDDRAAYVARLESLLGVSLDERLPQDRLNASPPAPYLFLLRRINAMLERRAPEIIESADWKNFVYIANYGAGSAPNLDAYAAEYLQGHSEVSDALPRLSAKAAKAIAGQMTVLAGLPVYEPFRRSYGVIAQGPAVAMEPSSA